MVWPIRIDGDRYRKSTDRGSKRENLVILVKCSQSAMNAGVFEGLRSGTAAINHHNGLRITLVIEHVSIKQIANSGLTLRV